ncbi:MAG: phage scaffolding protein [Bacilli bacterium]
MSKQLKDFLTGLDNSNEVERIINENMKNAGCKAFIDDGKDNIYIPKTRLDSKILDLKNATDTINELNTTIKTLQADVKGNEDATTKINELNTKIADYEKTVKEIQLKGAVQSIATEFKAKDSTGNDILAFIDKSKITIGADGTVTGIKEQVEALQKSKDYLFNPVEDPNQPPGLAGLFNFGNPGRPSNNDIFDSKTMHAGDFGKSLAKQNKTTDTEQVDSNYFFK